MLTLAAGNYFTLKVLFPLCKGFPTLRMCKVFKDGHSPLLFNKTKRLY